MSNDKLKKYVENKLKLLQISMREDESFYDESEYAYEVGFEDGEIKGAYDALMMVYVLMEKKDDYE